MIFDKIEDISQQKLILIISILSVAAIIPGWINYDIIARDGAHLYIPVARLFLEGKYHEAMFGGLAPLFPLPLYESLIFVVAKFSGLPLETSGRLVSALSFVLGSIGIFKVTDLLFKSKITALLSVLMYLSTKLLLAHSVDCLKESLLVCIVIWGNYFILEGIYSNGNKIVYFIVGSLILLMGVMVRSTSVIFLVGWFVVWVFSTKEGIALRLIILSVIFAIFIFISWLMPELPLFRRSLSPQNFLLITSYKGVSEAFGAFLGIIIQFIAINQNLMVIFGIAGALILRRGLYAKHIFICLAGFLIIMLFSGWNNTGHSSDRYILVMAMWILPASSYEIIRSTKSKSIIIKYIAFLTILTLPLLWATKAFAPPDNDYLARKEAGLWIYSQAGKGADVVTNRERIAYYAQGKIILLENLPITDKYDNNEVIVAKMFPPYNKSLHMSDVINNKRLVKILAIDTILDDGKCWKTSLDNLGIKPKKIFRSIYVYLPENIFPKPIKSEQHW